ncbi:hypothetical protein HPB49_021142 [Dermacentor silvarum]|uniref:Uncharacterized protein n=1 Tax=Dermacentor silvarum TaxID=543639 RepID=A0ACB8D898_DERSI|nr:hypothetical protein HPB49_021142 [Dermacentor silvarum]
MLAWALSRDRAVHSGKINSSSEFVVSSKFVKILGSVGIESDSERLNKVISELKGKTVDEVIAKEAAKKEEKKEESEEDDDMGFGLFD